MEEYNPGKESIEKFLASRTGLARIGSFSQLKDKLNKDDKKLDFPTFGMNLLLDEELLFSAATYVNLLPPVEEAVEGLFYIKRPENLLYFLLNENGNKEWLQLGIGNTIGNNGNNERYTGTASIDVGGIKRNDSFVNKTYKEMFDALINPALYPRFTNPSIRLQLNPNRTLFKVGETANLNLKAIFDRGKIEPAYGTSGFRSGEANSYVFIKDNVEENTQTSSEKTYTITTNSTLAVKANYNRGEQPKDSKNNNFDNPLNAGAIESQPIRISFTLPIYHNGANQNNVVEQGLLPLSQTELVVSYGRNDRGKEETFHIPNSWNIVKIQLQDIGGNWIDGNMNDWENNTTTHDTHQYKTFTDKRGLASQGPRKVKFIWRYN